MGLILGGQFFELEPNESAVLMNVATGAYFLQSQGGGWPVDGSIRVVWQGPSSEANIAWRQYAPGGSAGYVPPGPPASNPIAVPTPTTVLVPPQVIVNPGGSTTTIYHPDPSPPIVVAGPYTGTGGLLMVSGGAASWATKLGPTITGILKGLTGGSGKVSASTWSTMPGWLKSGLVAFGLQEGVEFSLDNILGGITGTGDYAVGGMLNGRQIVKVWNAGPTRMGMLANGTQFAIRKDGRVKMWRPKKPVAVIYSDGVAGDVRKLVKADRVLNKQTKTVDVIIKRRAKNTNTTKKKGKA